QVGRTGDRVGPFDPDVDRASDLARVPADRAAVLHQGLLKAGPVLRIAGDRVPLLRPARRGAQGPGPAAPADGDRWVRALHRLGLAPRVGEPDVLAVERGK